MTWWTRLWERSTRAIWRENARETDGVRSEHQIAVTSERPAESRFAFPFYAAIERSSPSGGHKDFSNLEDSPEIPRLREHFESDLLGSHRPADDKPLLTTLLSGASGVFTLILPNSEPCLLTFSTPLRAEAYARLHAGSHSLKYLASTPEEFAQMLNDLRSNSPIESVALDVCPYCLNFPALNIECLLTPGQVVELWAIHKSGELARECLFFNQANDACACGDFQLAKATIFEAVQHVTAESPRLHLLLGKVALSLGDKDLFREVKTVLRFLQADYFIQELLAAEKSSEIQN